MVNNQQKTTSMISSSTASIRNAWARSPHVMSSPNAVSDAEAHTLVKWVLAQK